MDDKIISIRCSRGLESVVRPLRKLMGLQKTGRRRKLGTFFHVAPWIMLKSIKQNGIIPGPSGAVFLCASRETAENFSVSAENKRLTDGARFAIIPVHVLLENVKKAASSEAGQYYAYPGPIPKKRIAPKKYIHSVDVSLRDGVFYGTVHYADGGRVVHYEQP